MIAPTGQGGHKLAIGDAAIRPIREASGDRIAIDAVSRAAIFALAPYADILARGPGGAARASVEGRV